MLTGNLNKRAGGVIAALTMMTTAAIAGPEGRYSVQGKNPDGSTYAGTATVERTGETYKVIWQIGGAQFTGSGLGAAPVKGMSVMGPADETDNTLAVGYVSGPENFGIAFYVEQEDGTWSGIWTYGGSSSVAFENWKLIE